MTNKIQRIGNSTCAVEYGDMNKWEDADILLLTHAHLPCHDFAPIESVPDSVGMKKFINEYPFINKMIGKSKVFASIMKKKTDIETRLMDFGDSMEL